MAFYPWPSVLQCLQIFASCANFWANCQRKDSPPAALKGAEKPRRNRIRCRELSAIFSAILGVLSGKSVWIIIDASKVMGLIGFGCRLRRVKQSVVRWFWHFPNQTNWLRRAFSNPILFFYVFYVFCGHHFSPRKNTKFTKKDETCRRSTPWNGGREELAPRMGADGTDNQLQKLLQRHLTPLPRRATISSVISLFGDWLYASDTRGSGLIGGPCAPVLPVRLKKGRHHAFVAAVSVLVF